MSGPCAKQHVRATLILKDGRRFTGTNEVDRPQRTCPRAGLASGVGYHLCVEVCRQPGHAESRAIEAATEAGARARGGVMYLEGHTYACAPCQALLDWAGVRLVIGPPPPL